jgi:hypothetical protein
VAGGAGGFTGGVSRFLLLPVLLLALVAVPATAPAVAPGKPAATKQRCPPGTTPVVRKQGKRAVPKRDRRGRLRCRTVMAGKPPAPAPTPVGQAGNVADSLRSVRAITPQSTAKLERALGRKRARRVLDVTLDGWQRAASAARAAQDTETTTFEPSEGVKGTLTIGGQEYSGDASGFNATASASVAATRAGIDGLAPGLKDKLPADIKAVRGQADVAFEDRVAACPDDKGERKGTVKATGKVKVTVERDGKPPIVVEQSLEVELTYTARSGGTIDVASTTEFSSGGSGVPTQTYRGRRFGTGFGRESIIDGGKDGVDSGVRRDYAHFSDEAGGVWGPRGGWNFARGVHVTDLRSFQNVEAMVTALIHTDLLTLAALEYVRLKSLPRAEKEECGYTVALNVNGRGVFATHDATGQIAVTVPANEVGEGAWHAQAPAPWTNLVFTTKHECGYVDPVSSGTFMADLTLDDGMLNVRWHVDLGIATASVDCPPDGELDPPPIPGQAGPGLVGATPMSFQLPATGGSQAITGGVQDGGEGFFNDGVLTVTRVR